MINYSTSFKSTVKKSKKKAYIDAMLYEMD